MFFSGAWNAYRKCLTNSFFKIATILLKIAFGGFTKIVRFGIRRVPNW